MRGISTGSAFRDQLRFALGDIASGRYAPECGRTSVVARTFARATIRASEIATVERPHGDRPDRRQVRGGEEPQRPVRVLRAAERAELDREAREAGRVGGERGEPVLVERLEGQDPGRDLGG